MQKVYWIWYLVSKWRNMKNEKVKKKDQDLEIMLTKIHDKLFNRYDSKLEGIKNLLWIQIKKDKSVHSFYTRLSLYVMSLVSFEIFGSGIKIISKKLPNVDRVFTAFIKIPSQMLLACVCACACTCVRVLVCVGGWVGGLWVCACVGGWVSVFLRGTDQRSCVVNILLGASAKFLHLRL